MLNANPTILANVNQDARDVSDSFFGETKFMLAKRQIFYSQICYLPMPSLLIGARSNGI